MLEIADLEKIEAIIDKTIKVPLSNLQFQIKRNTEDIAKSAEDIHNLDTSLKVSEVYIKTIYKRVDWKGWIAIFTILMGVIALWKG